LSAADTGAEGDDDSVPLWQEAQATPEFEILRQKESDTIRRLLADLPDLFREVLVLREINDLSYRDIAEVIGAPVGTVMSRLARARAMLRESWLAADKEDRCDDL
jgi:RNA polymerase sigma-70 factor (ECF subfamily)